MASVSTFEWDENKNKINQKKHGISFEEAQYAFFDTKRIIARDLEHSQSEERYYCFGQVDKNIVTVRFVYRNNKIRILGAGYWRKGRQVYEKENKIQQ
ncbi:MAG: BrnT family toxin [Ignavibacteriales bacterium]|nr:BrnT family toxin [Ignavibacteriales bacterium]